MAIRTLLIYVFVPLSFLTNSAAYSPRYFPKVMSEPRPVFAREFSQPELKFDLPTTPNRPVFPSINTESKYFDPEYTSTLHKYHDSRVLPTEDWQSISSLTKSKFDSPGYPNSPFWRTANPKPIKNLTNYTDSAKLNKSSSESHSEVESKVDLPNYIDSAESNTTSSEPISSEIDFKVVLPSVLNDLAELNPTSSEPISSEVESKVDLPNYTASTELSTLGSESISSEIELKVDLPSVLFDSAESNTTSSEPISSEVETKVVLPSVLFDSAESNPINSEPISSEVESKVDIPKYIDSAESNTTSSEPISSEIDFKAVLPSVLFDSAELNPISSDPISSEVESKVDIPKHIDSAESNTTSSEPISSEVDFNVVLPSVLFDSAESNTTSSEPISSEVESNVDLPNYTDLTELSTSLSEPISSEIDFKVVLPSVLFDSAESNTTSSEPISSEVESKVELPNYTDSIELSTPGSEPISSEVESKVDLPSVLTNSAEWNKPNSEPVSSEPEITLDWLLRNIDSPELNVTDLVSIISKLESKGNLPNYDDSAESNITNSEPISAEVESKVSLPNNTDAKKLSSSNSESISSEIEIKVDLSSYTDSGEFSTSSSEFIYPDAKFLASEDYPSSYPASIESSGRYTKFRHSSSIYSEKPTHVFASNHYYSSAKYKYLDAYRNSEGRYGDILAGLVLYNMVRSREHYYINNYQDDYYWETHGDYSPEKVAFCTINIKENGGFQLLKIPCEIVSTIPGRKHIPMPNYSKRIGNVCECYTNIFDSRSRVDMPLDFLSLLSKIRAHNSSTCLCHDSLANEEPLNPMKIACIVEIRTIDGYLSYEVSSEELLTFSRIPIPQHADIILPERQKLEEYLKNLPWWLSLFTIL